MTQILWSIFQEVATFSGLTEQRMVVKREEKEIYLPNRLKRFIIVNECELEDVEKNGKRKYEKKMSEEEQEEL